MSLLAVDSVDVAYGGLRALTGVSLTVDPGETVALMGANGAGKSTLLHAVMGATRPSTGTIVFDGVDITAASTRARVAAGIAIVPEGRRLFPSLTVRDNLLIGAAGAPRRAAAPALTRVLDLLPLVADRIGRPTGTLSGGEQQAVAIGRALMSNPRLLLLDELSLGLAPAVVDGLYTVLAGLAREGTAMVLVEQDASRALAVAARAYCLLEGRVTLTGPASSLTLADVTTQLLGI